MYPFGFYTELLGQIFQVEMLEAAGRCQNLGQPQRIVMTVAEGNAKFLCELADGRQVVVINAVSDENAVVDETKEAVQGLFDIRLSLEH